MLRLLIAVMILAAAGRGYADNDRMLRQHPGNPHYLTWRGEPIVLITSGEHYGAVLNSAFDYETYLKTLEHDGLNLTRVFSGAYCEPPGSFNIQNNTLAPAEGDLVTPWARSEEPGYANGGMKFDLTRWDEKYFKRLKKFVKAARRRGIVVEYVFFCPFYGDEMWALSPMNAANNVNVIGAMPREEVYSLQHATLTAIQVAMVQEVVRELNEFDNLYYEICNEPFYAGVTLDWQKRIADAIVEAEVELKNKHLIAQNFDQQTPRIEHLNPAVRILNWHYAKPPFMVDVNYDLNRVMADDETGFAGSDAEPYRREAWDFIMAGGAIFDHLDYSFSVGNEDGEGTVDAPGGGGREIRRQLSVLKSFVEAVDVVSMQPSDELVTSETPSGTTVRLLAEAGSTYIAYVNGPNITTLSIELPAGGYQATWVDPTNGQAIRIGAFAHGGGVQDLVLPAYAVDLALQLVALPEE